MTFQTTVSVPWCSCSLCLCRHAKGTEVTRTDVGRTPLRIRGPWVLLRDRVPASTIETSTGDGRRDSGLGLVP